MGSDLTDWHKHLQALESAKHLPVNYDPRSYLDSTTRMGWTIDNHRGHLGFEKPGPPEARGIFAKAVEVIKNYQFTDRKLIQGFFNPDEPLLGRDMILEAHFLGFTFRFANRVNAVIDRQISNSLDHPCQVWGYSYQTLQGHFEEGQMTFEIWKDLVSGEISFHIDAYSKFATIKNIFYRIGFYLFKRPLQKLYIRTAIAKMQMLVKV